MKYIARTKIKSFNYIILNRYINSILINFLEYLDNFLKFNI